MVKEKQGEDHWLHGIHKEKYVADTISQHRLTMIYWLPNIICSCFVSQTECQLSSELNLTMVKCKLQFTVGLEPGVKTTTCVLVQSNNWLIRGRRKQLFE